MNSKHAYLIMAHNEFGILEKLILLLDDKRNDIYIHIDSKVKRFDFKHYYKLVKKSNIYFISRKNVSWGHFNSIQCEVQLIKKSIIKEYRYYHLISGVDLPIKTQNEIHEFFERNNGLEFIHFCPLEESEMVKDRILHYNFIRFHKSNKLLCYLGKRINNLVNTIQYKLKFERIWDSEYKICYGANWFSITHELAQYILENEKFIKKHYRYSSCADEIFLQTLVYNSEFRNKIYNKEFNGDYRGCLREIDFKRGNPYIYRSIDFEKLVISDNMFARKFSSTVDSNIIDDIFFYIQTKQNI